MTLDNTNVTEIRLVRVTESPLDAVALEALAHDHSAGAVVTFCGNVRDHDHGRRVESLHYEGHPSAQQELEAVAAELAARFDVVALVIAHRIGALAMGDTALFVAVSAAHRGEAFTACAAAVDLTKERLPVWKYQRFTDGTDEWVNCA